VEGIKYDRVGYEPNNGHEIIRRPIFWQSLWLGEERAAILYPSYIENIPEN
jgi:hypothetical protein